MHDLVAASLNTSMEACEKFCLEDCKCVAALYSSGESRECYLYGAVMGVKQVERGTGSTCMAKVPKGTHVEVWLFCFLSMGLAIIWLQREGTFQLSLLPWTPIPCLSDHECNLFSPILSFFFSPFLVGIRMRILDVFYRLFEIRKCDRNHIQFFFPYRGRNWNFVGWSQLSKH